MIPLIVGVRLASDTLIVGVRLASDRRFSFCVEGGRETTEPLMHLQVPPLDVDERLESSYRVFLCMPALISCFSPSIF